MEIIYIFYRLQQVYPIIFAILSMYLQIFVQIFMKYEVFVHVS